MKETPLAGPQSGATTKLDEGQLDPTWFETDGRIQVHVTKTIDYLWVREGLSLSNRRFHLERWETPRLNPERDDRDREKATDLTGEMSELVNPARCERLKAGSTCSLTEGGIRIVGRFVNINAGRAAVFV